MTKPTRGFKTITLPNGCHRKIPTYSFGVLMTEIGGTQVKAVRIDDQASKAMAAKRAIEENPGWRFRALTELNDRDFSPEEETI